MIQNGFNRKEITKILDSKITKFLDYYKIDLKYKDNIIVTGGAIASLLLGETPSDYDLYFTNVDVLEKLVIEKFTNPIDFDTTEKKCELPTTWEIPKGNQKVTVVPGELHFAYDPKEKTDGPFSNIATISKETLPLLPSWGHDAFYGKTLYSVNTNEIIISSNHKDVPHSTKSWKIARVSHYSISFIDSDTGKPDVQITAYCGAPKHIHSNFDFIHCINYYNNLSGLVYYPEAMESLLTKELKYIGTRYPLNTLGRIRKFVQRGWTISNMELLKIFYDISNLELETSEDWERQVPGITDYVSDSDFISRDRFVKSIDKASS